MRRNLATSLRQRVRARPMDRYDRLPGDLRIWLAQAALPWSAASALRLWTRALGACCGDPVAARSCLDRIEARMLARDAPQIWGGAYPLQTQARPDR